VAQNIAVCFANSGYKVCIVDADTNQSAIRWSGLRNEEKAKVPVFGLPDGASLAANIKPLNEDYEIILIDGTPSLSKITSKIILLADLLLIPILPSGLDVWATEHFIERYNEACEQKESKIPAYFILNKFKPNTNFSKEVRDLLPETGISVMTNVLNDRVAYAEAVVQGLGVFEYKDEKAKKEITKLFNELIENIQHLNEK
jgi:chromosome partitioning protein